MLDEFAFFFFFLKKRTFLGSVASLIALAVDIIGTVTDIAVNIALSMVDIGDGIIGVALDSSVDIDEGIVSITVDISVDIEEGI